ncbi:MAG: TetR/AcrR family transcriptional regulator [Rhodobacteraceae bacterium]|nr:TetR/AcrR family transcriptional regulator [Paracoccaceae bacterium]
MSGARACARYTCRHAQCRHSLPCPALIEAFFQLIMEERYAQLSVSRVCAKARVARSTFYIHFRNLDDLLLAHIGPQIERFAQGLQDSAKRDQVLVMVEHFWEQRRLSELWRDARFRDLFEDALQAALARNAPARAAMTRHQAAGVTAVLRHWIAGRITARPDQLAQTLITLTSDVTTACQTPPV